MAYAQLPSVDDEHLDALWHTRSNNWLCLEVTWVCLYTSLTVFVHWCCNWKYVIVHEISYFINWSIFSICRSIRKREPFMISLLIYTVRNLSSWTIINGSVVSKFEKVQFDRISFFQSFAEFFFLDLLEIFFQPF